MKKLLTWYYNNKERIQRWIWFVRIAYRMAPGVYEVGKQRMYADMVAYVMEPDDKEKQRQRILSLFEDILDIQQTYKLSEAEDNFIDVSKT